MSIRVKVTRTIIDVIDVDTDDPVEGARLAEEHLARYQALFRQPTVLARDVFVGFTTYATEVIPAEPVWRERLIKATGDAYAGVHAGDYADNIRGRDVELELDVGGGVWLEVRGDEDLDGSGELWVKVYDDDAEDFSISAKQGADVVNALIDFADKVKRRVKR